MFFGAVVVALVHPWSMECGERVAQCVWARCAVADPQTRAHARDITGSTCGPWLQVVTGGKWSARSWFQSIGLRIDVEIQVTSRVGNAKKAVPGRWGIEELMVCGSRPKVSFPFEGNSSRR